MSGRPGTGRDPIARIGVVRATQPELIAEMLGRRRRRPFAEIRGPLLMLTADATARGVLGAGGSPTAMADREDFLRRLAAALENPGIDGLIATADVVEDLAGLGLLDRRLVAGSMNRGGVAGSVFESDDRFTAYGAEAIGRAGLDAGKLLFRFDPQDEATLRTMVAAAAAIDALAALRLPVLVEVFSRPLEIPLLVQAAAIASGLGGTSAYTWLQLPVIKGIEQVLAATTLPVLLVGGDPTPQQLPRWRQLLERPRVRGVVIGRGLLYPDGGDVAGAVAAVVGALKPERTRPPARSNRPEPPAGR